MTRQRQARHQLAEDTLFIFFGVCLAALLSRTGLIDAFLNILGSSVVASFLAGIFFTSVFSIAPAALALTHLAETTPVFVVVFWGALGALCGDLVLFFFIRDRFAEDIRRSLKPSFVKSLAHSFHFGFLKWFSPILGAAIIASPLPDELGLTLMGLSKIRVAYLVPIAFAMNMLGIYLLARAALLF